MPDNLICSFYKFHPLDGRELEKLASELENRGTELGLFGLMILGTEGVNATICGDEKSLRIYIRELATKMGLSDDLAIKESTAVSAPFKRFKVKIREEIVTLGKPEVLPLRSHATHLSPAQWHEALQEPDTIVIDTRNWYETKLGKFKKAIDPGLDEFQQWPQFLEQSALPKDKKILIYCTGGIRCEKAIVEMKNQGFDNVYQLDGGILNYIKDYPNQGFDGECFVFDHRVAVDQSLQPSQKYKMCPHCGQPGDTVIDCLECGSKAVVCESCLEQKAQNTCSKNCAYHFQRKA